MLLFFYRYVFLDYCLRLHCYFQNVSADRFSGLLQVPEFDKHLKKAGGHIDRNVVEITIKMKTIVWKPLMIKIIKLCLRNLDNYTYVVVFANSPEDRGSIPGRVTPKT